MKSNKIFHVILLTVMAWLLLLAGVAGATAKSLLPSTVRIDGSTTSTSFAVGESFYLLIKVNDAANVAGATLTVEYDNTLFDVDETNVSGEAYFIATSNTFIQVNDTRTPPGTPITAVPSIGNMGTGKVMLSGAYVDPISGGGAYTGEQVLFKIKFKAKVVGAGIFTLKQSMLFNPDAGWGVTGGSAVAAPVLVGAVNKNDTNWGNLSLAFPVLLGDPNDANNPFPDVTSSSIGIVSGTVISGTISYTGKQAGTLNVAASSEATCTTPVGTGYQVAWPGSQQTYNVTAPSTTGSYYVCAFIDSGTADNIQSATDAYGSSAAIDISGTVTGKDFPLADPDVNLNGLPDWWEVKYGLYSTNPAIGMNDDYDNDGYSNLVEYQSYVSTASPGKNPTFPDTPGGTGYNPATDTQLHVISGTITYSGAKTGTLKVAAFLPTDNTYSSPIGTQSYTWASSQTSQIYTLNVTNGSYKIRAFIGTGATPVSTDAIGAYNTAVTLAGVPQTNKNFMMMDSNQKKQIVSASPAEPRAKASGSFSMDINYTTSDLNKTTSGLTIRMHYDSTKLTFAGISNTLTTAFGGGGTTSYDDTDNTDGDDTTDKYVQIGWVDQSKNWPNLNLPTRLFTATFNVAAGLADGTASVIRFSWVDGDFDYVLYADPVNFKVQSFNLNVDGSTEVAPQPSAKAYSDGLLIIRYLLGFQDVDLTQGLIPGNATRTTPAAIQGYLDTAGKFVDSPLNVDGSPETAQAAKAYSDGLLIIRYLLGFQDVDLTQGLIPGNATRTTPAQIKAFLDPLKP